MALHSAERLQQGTGCQRRGQRGFIVRWRLVDRAAAAHGCSIVLTGIAPPGACRSAREVVLTSGYIPQAALMCLRRVVAVWSVSVLALQTCCCVMRVSCPWVLGPCRKHGVRPCDETACVRIGIASFCVAGEGWGGCTACWLLFCSDIGGSALFRMKSAREVSEIGTS